MWVNWPERDNLNGINNPGVYALAVSDNDISNSKFDWLKEITYFGMTNSCRGLKSRLKQFDNTINLKEGHGGGERFRYKYRDYKKLIKKLFVAVCPIECDVTSNDPKDLLKMGEVHMLEFYCFAEYVTRFNELPEFNNKREATKLRKNELRLGEAKQLKQRSIETH
jgi:hypothetical protein